MEAEVTKKDGIIVDIEGYISKKDDDIQELENEVNDIENHIIKLSLDVKGEYLIIRTNQTLWDYISHIFMNEWDHYEVIQDELETCESSKEESKIVEIELGKVPK